MAWSCIGALAILASISLLLTFLFQRCVITVLSRKPPTQRGPLPGITVLKPLKGADVGLLDNLRSLGNQDYPTFEIVFGCEDPQDPARAVVERFIAEFPHVQVRTRFGHPPLGLNPKVANLAHMAKAARYDVYLISDASVRLQPDALRILAASLEDHVGLVCNILVGVGAKRLGALVDCLHLNSFVAASMAGARLLGKHTVVVGKSMLMRRRALERAGGWHGVRDVLAEDYVLGRRIEAAGFAVALSPMRIYTRDPERSLRECIARHVRWAQMRRFLSPAFWSEMLLNPAPVWLGVLVMAMAEGQRNFVALALFALFLKGIGDASMHRYLTGERMSLFSLLWVIPKDCIMAFAWIAGSMRRTVVWRGHHARIGAGSVLTLPAGVREPLIASFFRP